MRKSSRRRAAARKLRQQQQISRQVEKLEDRQLLATTAGGLAGIVPNTVGNDPGLVLWVSADDLQGTVNDGDSFVTWADQSGNGNDLTAHATNGNVTYNENSANAGSVSVGNSGYFTVPRLIDNANNDDDGEKGAGSKLAALLEIADARDVIVVVSRVVAPLSLYAFCCAPCHWHHPACVPRVSRS